MTGALMQRRFIALAMALLAAALPAVPVAAQTPTFCAAGQVPRYAAGFAELRARLGSGMGSPVTCEFPDPRGTGGVHQQTSKGLSLWSPSTNIPTFTDGHNHWALTPTGLVYWTGTSIEPPADARPAFPADPLYGELSPVAPCTWTEHLKREVFTCVYADAAPGSEPVDEGVISSALWAPAADGWNLLGYLPVSSTAYVYSDEGRSLFGQPAVPPDVIASPAPLPPAPPGAEPPRTDLRLTVADTVNTGAFDVNVRGQVCNRSTGWAATDVTVNFQFYNGSAPSGAGSVAVGRISAGQCRAFNEILTLNPDWTDLTVAHRWFWVRE